MNEELSLVWPELGVRSRPAASSHEDATVDIPSLVATHSLTLFRVAHSLLRNTAEAEDTVQDTFLRVLQHQRTLPAIRDLRPWLIRITWNLALDRRRRHTPDSIDEAFAATLAASLTPADKALTDAQHIARVLRAIDTLPAPERQSLLLAALEELSIPEIAATMQKSESAIRALLFRARTRLRQRLEAQTTRDTSKPSLPRKAKP